MSEISERGEAEADIILAAQTSEFLKSGGLPAEVACNIRLDRDEKVFGSVNSRLYAYTGKEALYSSSSWLVLGDPWLIAGSIAGSFLLNRRRRNAADREAAAQWRETNAGLLHVTTDRLALQGAMGWVDFDYQYFHAAELTDLGLIAHFADWPVIRLDSASPVWLWVMFNHFAFNRNIEVPIPDELAAGARCRAALGNTPARRPADATGPTPRVPPR